MCHSACVQHSVRPSYICLVSFVLPYEGGSFLRTIVAQRGPSRASSLRTPVGRPRFGRRDGLPPPRRIAALGANELLERCGLQLSRLKPGRKARVRRPPRLNYAPRDALSIHIARGAFQSVEPTSGTSCTRWAPRRSSNSYCRRARPPRVVQAHAVHSSTDMPSRVTSYSHEQAA